MPKISETDPLRGMSATEVLDSLKCFRARLDAGVYASTDGKQMLELAIGQLGAIAEGLSDGSIVTPVTPASVEQILEAAAAKVSKRASPKLPPFPECDRPSQPLSEMDFEALVNEVPVGKIDPPVDSRTCFLAGDLSVPTPTGYVAGLSLSDYDYGRRVAYSPDPTPGEQVFTIEYPNLTNRPRLAVPLGALAHLDVEDNALRPPTPTDPAVWATARPFNKLTYTVSKAPDEHPMRFLGTEAVLQLVPSAEEQKFWRAALPMPESLRRRGELAAKSNNWEEVFALVSSLMLAGDRVSGGTNFQYVCHPRYGEFLIDHQKHLPLIISTIQRGHCHALAWYAAGQLRSFGVPAWISMEAVVTKNGRSFNGSMLHARTVFCGSLSGELRVFCPASRVTFDEAFHPECLDGELVDQLDEKFRRAKTDRGRLSALNEFMKELDAGRKDAKAEPALNFGNWGLGWPVEVQQLQVFSRDRAVEEAARVAVGTGDLIARLGEAREMFKALFEVATPSELLLKGGGAFQSGRDTPAARASFNAFFSIARALGLPVSRYCTAGIWGFTYPFANLPVEECIMTSAQLSIARPNLPHEMSHNQSSWVLANRLLKEAAIQPAQQTISTAADLLIKAVVDGNSTVAFSESIIRVWPWFATLSEESRRILAQAELSPTGLELLRAGYMPDPSLVVGNDSVIECCYTDETGKLASSISHDDRQSKLIPATERYREQLRDQMILTSLLQDGAPKNSTVQRQIQESLGRIRSRAALNCELADRDRFFNPRNDPLTRFVNHRQTRTLTETPECPRLKGAISQLTQNLTLPPDQQAQLRAAFKRTLNTLDRNQSHSRDDDDRQPRSYTPGDDARLVDWNLYGRSDQLMVWAPQGKAVGLRSPVHVVVDTELLDDHFMTLRLIELAHVLQLDARATGREILVGASGMASVNGGVSNSIGIVARPTFAKINGYKGSPASILPRIAQVWQGDFRLAGGLPLINGVAPKTILFVSDNYTRICCMKRLLPGSAVTGLYLRAPEFNIYPVCPPLIDSTRKAANA